MSERVYRLLVAIVDTGDDGWVPLSLRREARALVEEERARREERREGLRRLTRLSQELGLYDEEERARRAKAQPPC